MNLEDMKAGSVLFTEPAHGTGYLIAKDRVATCHHVIEHWDKGETRAVFIGAEKRISRRATVINSDPEGDCAVLSLNEPVDIQPLPLADAISFDYKAFWEGYGYPGLAKRMGLLIKGEVLDPKTKDETGREILQLYCPQAAAGVASKLHGFSGTPVIVDNAVAGHVIRHIGDQDDRERPAYGVLLAAPVAKVVELLDTPIATRKINPPELNQASEFIEHVHKVAAREKHARPAIVAAVAKRLTAENDPEGALRVLEASTFKSLEIDHQRALALAKLGRIDEAIKVLKRRIDAGAKDAETLGLLAGRYKDKWRKSGNWNTLRASYQWYLKAYRAANDPFCGINVAATALLLGDNAEAEAVAKEVYGSLVNREDKDAWNLATLGEACLLRGRLDESREWYGRAVALEPDAHQNIAVMRRQARLELKALGRDESALDDILTVPKVVVFAGHMIDEDGRDPPRFPQSKVGKIRNAIKAKLEAYGFVRGFATAAAGSDIIFLEELIKRDGAPVVVMPFPEEDFRKTSVRGDWGERLDKIHDKLDIKILERECPAPSGQPDAFRRSAKKVLKMAVDYADRLDGGPNFLVVWDGKKRGKRGGTADTIQIWAAEGYNKLEVIDTTKP